MSSAGEAVREELATALISRPERGDGAVSSSPTLVLRICIWRDLNVWPLSTSNL